MTKSENREIKNVELYLAHGMTDTAARALSALIRAARTNKSAAALRELAAAMGVTGHPEFIC